MAVRAEFGLLGPLYVRSGGVMLPVTAARQRVVLATLAVRAGHVVSFEELSAAIWGDVPPSGARVAVRNHVSRLRHRLGGAGGQVVTRDPGYFLDAAEGDVDMLAFARLCREGGAAVHAGAWARASDLLGEALRLWRGMPLADVPSRALRDEHVPVAGALRLQAIEWQMEAGLHTGLDAELVAELEGLIREHPLRERFRAQLMLALHRCGRPGEALAAYRSARDALVTELGVEPGQDLRDLHQRILAADPQLLLGLPSAAPVQARTVLAGAAGEHGPDLAVPRQLPAAVRHFTGRRAELDALTGLLDQGGGAPGPVLITAIGGMAGVGKTALAVHWAHQIASRFPDGQLYVSLRGFDPSGRPAAPAEAIRGVLDALGVPAGQIPAGLDAQAGLYRSLLSGKRMLVLLDNARDAGQIRPLLPGGPGCLVVVTSRSQLAGLVAAEGAYALTLDLLTEAEAGDLLAARLGEGRLDAESAAAAELIGLCARLPLALAIAAARASARPGPGLDALARELRDTQRMLDALETGDAAASVRAVFSWSLQSLQRPAARMLAQLGLHPGPDITIPAAASLAGVPLLQARRALGELAGAHLIIEHAPGRFSLHDLLRAYAAEQAAASYDDTAQRATVARALDHYLHTAAAAALLLDPARQPVPLAPARPGVAPERLASDQQALAWFEAEHQVLLAAIALAAEAGFDACAWQLPWALDEFLDWRGHWHQSAANQRTALAAATRLGDTAGQATARNLLAHACARLGDYDQARAHLTECLGLCRQLGDRAGQARAHQCLGIVAEQQGRHADGLVHDEQALALYRVTGDLSGQAAALNNVGHSRAWLGDYQQAQAFCREAVDLYRQLGHRPGEAGSWDSLGYAEHKLGHLTEATACHRRAAGILRDLGDRYSEAQALTHLGDVRHTAGDLPEARDAWQQALEILDDLHHPDAAPLRAKLRQHHHPSAIPPQT